MQRLNPILVYQDFRPELTVTGYHAYVNEDIMKVGTGMAQNLAALHILGKRPASPAVTHKLVR